MPGQSERICFAIGLRRLADLPVVDLALARYGNPLQVAGEFFRGAAIHQMLKRVFQLANTI